MLACLVLVVRVVEAPILQLEGFGALHEGMHELVEDHLREAIVLIQLLGCCDEEIAAASVEANAPGIRDHLEAHTLSAGEPDSIERVFVAVKYSAHEIRGERLMSLFETIEMRTALTAHQAMGTAALMRWMRDSLPLYPPSKARMEAARTGLIALLEQPDVDAPKCAERDAPGVE